MNKARRPISTVFTFISIIAVIVVLIFVNQNKQKKEENVKTREKMTEIEQMLALDLDSDYPKTPREVAKLHGDMTRLLYSGLDDGQIKQLALKIRELCDEEFLERNPEEQYLTDLYTDISLWKEFGRHIELSLVVHEDKEEFYEKDGRSYATAFVSFTIQEKAKTSELRRYIMRKDDQGRWKILGWEYITED